MRQTVTRFRLIRAKDHFTSDTKTLECVGGPCCGQQAMIVPRLQTGRIQCWPKTDTGHYTQASAYYFPAMRYTDETFHSYCLVWMPDAS